LWLVGWVKKAVDCGEEVQTCELALVLEGYEIILVLDLRVAIITEVIVKFFDRFPSCAKDLFDPAERTGDLVMNGIVRLGDGLLEGKLGFFDLGLWLFQRLRDLLLDDV
jgi:hypothetical protein